MTKEPAVQALRLVTTIPRSRRIYLRGRINAKRADQLVSEILRLSAESPLPIYLLISSRGGNFDSAMRIYSTIQSSRAPILGVVATRAYSGAAIILQACKWRIARPEARILLHYNVQNYMIPVAPFMDTDALKMWLDRSVIPSLEQSWSRAHKLLFEQVQKVGKTDEQLHDLLRRNLILTAEEAFRWGFVDHVLSI